MVALDTIALARRFAPTPALATRMQGAALVGVFWGDHARREPSRVVTDLVQLVGWLRAGKLRPEVTARYPLERAPEAIAALLDRKATGKLVIELP